MSILIVCPGCTNEETNEFFGTSSKAKIDMNSTVLPIQRDKNEQHYYKLSFTDNEFAIDLVDSNGVTVLSDIHEDYRVVNDNPMPPRQRKQYKCIIIRRNDIYFIDYYGKNFHKQ